MTEWQIFLRSKVFGDDYGSKPIAGNIDCFNRWVVDHSDVNEFVKLGKPNVASDITFLAAEKDSEVLLGVWGRGEYVLGEQHPHSWDNKLNVANKGRGKGFYLGYVAPKGTPLPSAADIEQMRSLIREDLERMFNSAVAAGEYGQSTEVFTRVLPSSPPSGSSVWDRTVAAMNGGTAGAGVLEWEQGKESKFTSLGALKAPPLFERAARSYEHSAEVLAKKGAGQNTANQCIIGIKKLRPSTKIAAGVAIIGAAGYVVNLMIAKDGLKENSEVISKTGRKKTSDLGNNLPEKTWVRQMVAKVHRPRQSDVER